MVNKVETNSLAVKAFEEANGIKINMPKLKKAWTTFQFDKEFTFKVHPLARTSEEYYRDLSCI